MTTISEAQCALKWSGLTDAELEDVVVALDSDWAMYTSDADKERVRALALTAQTEAKRRGLPEKVAA
jgi:hypothetical protein